MRYSKTQKPGKLKFGKAPFGDQLDTLVPGKCRSHCATPLLSLPEMNLRRLPLLLSLFLTLCPAELPAADSPPSPQPKTDNSLIDEPSVALRKFTVAPGLKVDLFAAEPDVRNPVALSVDEDGRVFVVESDRRRSSVFDIRGHKDWLDADLSFRTIRERAEFLRQQISPTNPAVIKRLTGGGRGLFEDFNRDGVVDWHDLEVQSERIRMLEDTDHNGRADRISVFADGFTNLIAGVAAGVLAERGEVWFACIPDLWRLSFFGRTVKLAIPSSVPVTYEAPRTKLLSGFGVHIAFGGHDMHGLIFGPDGKLYWSIADRGTDTNLFARIKNPIPGLTPELLADSGCVFRSNPDGTDFEVIAWGLRNPQELAFDEFGNLFTADNNGDGGDKARWHYIVEGADFGWRIGWQWLEGKAYQPKMGAWNGERLWHLAESNTAAWLLPPLAHIGHGPAGLAYNPGTGLPPQFEHHFFLCDFPGHVLMWTNVTDGASFKTGPVRNFFGDLGPTDVAFHPDGGVLVTDWLKTFDKTDKGRVYRIHDPATDQSDKVQETRKLLAGGLSAKIQEMRGRVVASTNLPIREQTELGDQLAEEAATFFEHPDLRVRMAALHQFSDSNRRSWSPFLWFILWRRPGSSLHRAVNRPLPCMYALWSETSRLKKEPPRHPLDARGGREVPFMFLHQDSNVEVRFHYASLLGECGDESPARNGLQTLLTDSSPRVRMAAVTALGKWTERRRRQWGADALSLQTSPGNDPTAALLEIVRLNDDKDLYLRHAAVVALSRIGDTNALLAATTNAASHAVRMAALLTLRRLGSVEVSRFLADADPEVVLEAARAIHDVPIETALPALAAWRSKSVTDGSFDSELTHFTHRRVLNANFRLGGQLHAQTLVTFAAQTNVPPATRLEALELLAQWRQPPGRDAIMGIWRPLPSRPAEPAADALRPVLTPLLRDTRAEIKLASLRAAHALKLPEAEPFSLFSDTAQPGELRLEALRTLAQEKDPRLGDALQLAITDRNEAIRVESTRLQGSRANVVQIGRVLETGTIAEKQAALGILGTSRTPGAVDLIGRQFDALVESRLPKELMLDVLDAATQHSSFPDRLARYTNSLPKNDPLAVWRPVLYGGQADAGRATFYDNQQVACFRCHKLKGEGGEVGPELTGLTSKRGRDYLLESIVFPNKSIAPGFESALLTMKNGTEYAGVIKSETATELELNSPEDGLLKLKKTDIAERRRGLSAMPEELITILSRHELRDLIEFLASEK
jgi:quinoprotein glucose dehydrogenase